MPASATTLLLAVAQRHLAGQAPAGAAIGIEVQLELVVDRGAGADHRQVLLQIGGAERRGKDIDGGAADQARRTPQRCASVWLTEV